VVGGWVWGGNKKKKTPPQGRLILDEF